MKTYNNLWDVLCSIENLEKAYRQARKHKTANLKVEEFDRNWRLNLCVLFRELREKTYRPRPLRKFILRDPKTRLICVSDFRDRIVHHALVNVLHPIFEPRFIFDSYASRKGKGTLAALQRFDHFKRKVTKNGRQRTNARNSNDVTGFALKADIRHYFQTVDHGALLSILGKRIKDDNVMWLVKIILDNYKSELPGKGMPLGNWTSQFFANVYLNELDQYVKHKLGVRHYIRYVDDFVILHRSRSVLQAYEEKIRDFLTGLKLELHPDKCKIIPLRKGVNFLGFRIFYHHKLVRKRNLQKIRAKISHALDAYEENQASAWGVLDILQGWFAYAMHANTFKLRKQLRRLAEDELEKRTLIRNVQQSISMRIRSLLCAL